MKIIDPHLHLFHLENGEYAWLKPENPPFWPDKHIINQNFSIDNLQLIDSLTLAGFVHIEAGFNNEQPWQEIKWLESLNSSVPFKSVAYIDITLDSHTFIQHVKELQPFNSLIGCRYILDKDIDKLLTQPNVRNNLAVIADQGWLFELQTELTSDTVTDCIVTLCADILELKVIINHAGFVPRAQNNEALINWQKQILTLSSVKQIAIKCSGWEMTDRTYKITWLNQSIKHIIKCFGANRVMLASNFPLTLFNQSYNALWHQYVGQLRLPEQVKRQVCYLTAKTWYRL